MTRPVRPIGWQEEKPSESSESGSEEAFPKTLRDPQERLYKA